MKELLPKIAAHLRAMQIFYHSAHHHASRVGFFGDHSAFNDFYLSLEEQFDSCAERTIGVLGAGALNLQTLMAQVMPKIQNCPSNMAKDNSELFQYGLQMEQELISLTEAFCKSPASLDADKQLISEFGNKSQDRIYKIKQRIKK